MENQVNETQISQEANSLENVASQAPSKKQKKGKIPLIIGCVVALLLIIGGLAFFLTRDTTPYKPDASLIPVYDGKKWGYIDRDGNYVIKPQFQSVTWFSDGMAQVVNYDGKVGFIDKSGSYVINPKYNQATIFHEGLAFVVSEGNYPVCIDKKGKTVFELRDAEFVCCFQEGLAPYCVISKDAKDTIPVKWGFVDKTGKTAITPQYVNVRQFYEGLAACCQKKKDKTKWGFMDKEGKMVIEPQFDTVMDFSDGLAAIQLGDKWGFIDKEGHYAITPQYQFVTSFHNGKASFFKDRKWGILDKKGKVTVNPQFRHVGHFLYGENLAPVCQGYKWGFIDGNGQYVIESKFEEVTNFIDGMAFATDGGLWGIINTEGKYIVNPQFVHVLSPILDLDAAIQSEYYDATLFLNSFFSSSDASTLDGIQIDNPTLNDIRNNSRYSTLWEDNCSYYRINIDLSDTIVTGITLTNANFEFSDQTYRMEAEYENHTEYYGYYSYTYRDYVGSHKVFNYSAPCTQLSYTFKLNNNTAPKNKGIFNSLCEKLKKIYGGEVSSIAETPEYNEYSSGTNINVKKVTCDNVNFIVYCTPDGIELEAYFDKNTFENRINFIKERLSY